MGIDLRMLPYDHYDKDSDWGFSHTILNVGLRGTLYEKLNALPDVAVPRTFSTFCGRVDGETGYSDTQFTAYGEPMRAVGVADLLTLADDPDVVSSEQNRATWGYLAQLDKSDRVALYWY